MAGKALEVALGVALGPGASMVLEAARESLSAEATAQAGAALGVLATGWVLEA